MTCAVRNAAHSPPQAPSIRSPKQCAVTRNAVAAHERAISTAKRRNASPGSAFDALRALRTLEQATPSTDHASRAQRVQHFSRIGATAIQVAMHRLAIEQSRYIGQTIIKAQDVFDVRVVVIRAAISQLPRFGESGLLPFAIHQVSDRHECRPEEQW